MRTRVLFFTRLRDDTLAADYERWVVETDYPTARTIPAIVSYEVMRVEGPLHDAGLDYDYIEVVEVEDIDSYRDDLAGFSGRERFVEQIRSFLGPAEAVYGPVIE